LEVEHNPNHTEIVQQESEDSFNLKVGIKLVAQAEVHEAKKEFGDARDLYVEASDRFRLWKSKQVDQRSPVVEKMDERTVLVL
jgi:hypothetical protein